MKDGGPAFPVTSYVNADGETLDSPKMGMSLRDWFAGQALAGPLAERLRGTPRHADYPRDLAAYAYACADAMLAARAEGSAKDE